MEKDKKFGRLTAQKLVGRNNQYNQIWEFLCDCGKRINALVVNVRRGKTTSCGCFGREQSSKRKLKHGMNRIGLRTRFYRIFMLMKQRCNNIKIPIYENYGGRGIECLWKSFEDFKRDMYDSYVAHVAIYGEDDTSIDRVDNFGNYCKINCKWSTRKEQGRNKRNNVILFFRGKYKTVVELAEEFSIRPSTLYQQVYSGQASESDINLLIHK